MSGNDQDPEHWERSTNLAHALIEGSEQTVYLGVTEFYVGLHESSGGKGLRTTRYEFYVKCEHDNGDSMEMRVPISPWTKRYGHDFAIMTELLFNLSNVLAQAITEDNTTRGEAETEVVGS